jgi:hypothetical protein
LGEISLEAVRKLNFSRNFLIFYEQNFLKKRQKRCFRTASKVATSNKEQQLAVLAEARMLQTEMKKRLGKPLPSSAQEIRVLREERIRRAS